MAKLSNSKSFELRRFSSDPCANGETDFKGETATMTTDERIAFLEAYAEVATIFFEDPDLDTLAVKEVDVDRVMAKLRPQPLPSVRRVTSLSEWRWQAGRGPSNIHELPPLPDGVKEADECWEWERASVVQFSFEPQKWRAWFEARLVLSKCSEPVLIKVGKGVTIRLRGGKPCRVNGTEVGDDIETSEIIVIKCELDLVPEGGKFNLFVNGLKVADWVSLESPHAVSTFSVSAGIGFRLLECRGLGFTREVPAGFDPSPDQPFYFNPLFSYDFHPQSTLERWEKPDYDDSCWRNDTAPCRRGGILEAGQDLFLRAHIDLGRFERATFRCDWLDPGGELWINGQLAHRQEGPHHFALDVTRWLHPGPNNLVAVRVYHRPPVKVRMRHTSTDRHTGWSMGRAWLDLHRDRYLDNLFVWTESLGDSARLRWQVEVRNQHWGKEEPEPKALLYFHGCVRVELSPWFPKAGGVVAKTETKVAANFNETVTVHGTMDLANPETWSPERPFLYQVRAVLIDENGTEIDDRIITTGVRTISQAGGVFRVNGKPSMMNGGLLFATCRPLDIQSRNLRCGTDRELVRDVLMGRELGNTIRMSIHDSPFGGVNDPRYAEIGDQLGIIFQWTTNEWVRTSSPWQLSVEKLQHDAKRVWNHPSIVMWQIGNHPKFINWREEGARWFSMILDALLELDPSRLVSPTANFDQLHAPSEDGTVDRDTKESIEPLRNWAHPRVARGGMEVPTGYGAEWSALRLWPHPRKWTGEQGWMVDGFKSQYLESPTHAFFDFESEESTAQPNWVLCRGQPYHYIRSYEGCRRGSSYEEGSIGRFLECDEWRISQAWQAFSAYEAYRKKRLLDYDGMVWCTLDGGANTGTYEKPITDAMGHKKLAFHTVRMAFQKTFAGSANVDTVYGPEDAIHPVIFHLGDALRVDLEVRIMIPLGKCLATRTYAGVDLPAGRSSIRLDPWPRPDFPDGLYVIYYEVKVCLD